MNEAIYKSDLLRIELCPECEDPVHPAYLVIANENDVLIGTIKWNLRLEEYCLIPKPKTWWNWDALGHVLSFLFDEISRRVIEPAKAPAP